MKRTARFVACAALTLAAAPALQAQGSITSGDAVWTRTATGFGTNPTAHLTGVSAPTSDDHVFEFGWWFRLSGDTQENVFGVPTGQVYDFLTSTLDWSSLGGGAFSAQEVTTVSDTGSGGVGDSGAVTATMTITNLTGSALDINLFNMVDVDLQPTFDNDQASLLAANSHIQLFDAGANTAEYRAPATVGPAATAFLVRPGGASDVGAELSAAAVDTFDNSGLPFAAGDVTAGFQWTASIPAMGSRSFQVILTVNGPATPVELLSVSVE